MRTKKNVKNAELLLWLKKKKIKKIGKNRKMTRKNVRKKPNKKQAKLSESGDIS